MSRSKLTQFNLIANSLTKDACAIRLGICSTTEPSLQQENVVYLGRTTLVGVGYLRTKAESLRAHAFDLLLALDEYERAQENKKTEARNA